MRLVLTCVTLCSALVLAAPARAEPYAPVPDAKGDTGVDALKKSMPDKAEVDVPAYPGAVAVSGMGAMKKDALAALNLVSKDELAKVVAWYKEKLGDGWQYADKFGAHHFWKGKKEDWSMMPRVPTVVIQETSGKGFDEKHTTDAKSRLIVWYRASS